jgi:hypothetical protein
LWFFLICWCFRLRWATQRFYALSSLVAPTETVMVVGTQLDPLELFVRGGVVLFLFGFVSDLTAHEKKN